MIGAGMFVSPLYDTDARTPPPTRGGLTSDFQAIADRVEIDALLGELNDAGMQRDYDRFTALLTENAAWRMPNIPVEFVGREEIRAGVERMQNHWQYFVQNTHPGTIELDSDQASGGSYIFELMHGHDGDSQLHYALYHDRYERTPEGWRFAERAYEIRYLDTTPLAGSGRALKQAGS